MGARTSDTLKEIEQIRARLDGTLRSLEGRMPPVARIGKRALAVAGGGTGAGIALMVLRSVRGRRSKRRTQAASPPVHVTVRSGTGVAVAAVAIAWAVVRVVEATAGRDADRAESSPLHAVSSIRRA